MNTTVNIKESTAKLAELLNSLSEEQMNKIPFEHSWSAAQVGDHILKSNTGIYQVINGEVNDANRESSEYVSILQEMMLDFDSKAQADKRIWPREEKINKEELINSLNEINGKMISASEKLDLSKLCLSQKFPTMSYLTRNEWIEFAAAHTKRHNHQIQEIIKRI